MADNQETEAIPACYLVKACLEEQLLAAREKRPVTPGVLEFEHFLDRMVSDILGRLVPSLSDEECDDDDDHDDAVREIYAMSAFVAKTLNVLALSFVELGKEYFANPKEFQPRSFDERLIEAYEIRKRINSDSPKFRDVYAKLKVDPVSGLAKCLGWAIVERRLLRRYLRSRFGVSLKFRKRQKRSHRREIPFYEWFPRTNPDYSSLSTEQMETAYREYLFFIDNERQLQHYAEARLRQLEVQFTLWKSSIFMSFESLVKKHGGIDFPITEFAADILSGIEPAFAESWVVMEATTLKIKREFSLGYEDNLLNLAASIAAKLNPNVNRSLQDTMSGNSKTFHDVLVEEMPGNVLIALEDKNNERQTLHSKVAKLLSVEQPIEVKHTSRLQRQNRDERKKFPDDGPACKPRSEKTVNPDDLPNTREQDFALLEEARIDLAKIIRRSKLSASESTVYALKLQGLSEREIAVKLGRKVGTIKSLYHRAKIKILQNQPQ